MILTKYQRKANIMGTVTPTKLLNLWAQENISVEMAIGHILQNLVLQQKNLDTANSALHQIRADMNNLQENLAPVNQRQNTSIEN